MGVGEQLPGEVDGVEYEWFSGEWADVFAGDAFAASAGGDYDECVGDHMLWICGILVSADGHGYEPCGVGYVEGGHEYAFGAG